MKLTSSGHFLSSYVAYGLFFFKRNHQNMLDIFETLFSVLKSTAGGFGLICFLGWYLCRVAYNVYLHPLSIFPSPKLAGATRWYEGYFDNWSAMAGSTCMRFIAFIKNTVGLAPKSRLERFPFRQLTHLAGPIVRIAPNESHIKDVDYDDTLYALGVKRDKIPYMIDIFGTTLASQSIQHTHLVDHVLSIYRLWNRVA